MPGRLGSPLGAGGSVDVSPAGLVAVLTAAAAATSRRRSGSSHPTGRCGERCPPRTSAGGRSRSGSAPAGTASPSRWSRDPYGAAPADRLCARRRPDRPGATDPDRRAARARVRLHRRLRHQHASRPGPPPSRPGTSRRPRSGTWPAARRTVLRTEGRDVGGEMLFPVVGGVFETTQDGAMYWYPTGSDTPAQQFANHVSDVQAVETDAAGTVMVSGASDHRIVIADLVPVPGTKERRWETREALTGHQGNVVAIDVAADGSRAWSAGDDGTILTWDLDGQAGFGTPLPRARRSDPATGACCRSASRSRPARARTPSGWCRPSTVSRGHHEDEARRRVRRSRDAPAARQRPGHGLTRTGRSRRRQRAGRRAPGRPAGGRHRPVVHGDRGRHDPRTS